MLTRQWQLALEHDGSGAKQCLAVAAGEVRLERSVEVGSSS